MSILATAACVLRCFSGSRHDVTVTDLVALLGIPKSNASRLLRAMRDAEMLETVGASKRYRPSALIHQAGQVFRFSMTLIDRADAVVRRAAELVGHTAYVSVRQGTEIVGITVHPGRQALRVVSNIGERLPAFASSTGRALLARLSDAEILALYPDGFTAPSPSAPQDRAALLARIVAVRVSGYAESDDEAVPGVGAISVAVGDPATGDAVALCVSFPAATVAPEERAAIIRMLGDGAAGIAAVTGDPLFTPARIPASEQVS